MKKEEIESVILASSHYLFEDLPNNFYKWPEKKKYINIVVIMRGNHLNFLRGQKYTNI